MHDQIGAQTMCARIVREMHQKAITARLDRVQCSLFRETDSGAHGALFQPGDARRLTVLQGVLPVGVL